MNDNETNNNEESHRGLAQGLYSLGDRLTTHERATAARLDMIEKRLRQGNKMFHRIEETVFDPKGGVIVQLDQVKNSQNDIADDVKTIKETIARLAWVIVLSVIAGLLAMLGLSIGV